MLKALYFANLDPDHFVIHGSAALWVCGLRRRISDVDVVARGSAWARALEHADFKVRPAPLSRDDMVLLHRGRIEVSKRWVTDDSDTDRLIARADVIGGLRFARKEDILRSKRKLNRIKDQRDIAALCYLPPCPR
jgi:hypothetical protein